MRRFALIVTIAAGLTVAAAPIASACGFLVAENGAVRLGKTTTFVAWEDGIEHYITNFTFEGDVESFGSIIPLPAIPTDVRRAGDWTLQRLQREVNATELRAGDVALAAASEAVVLFQTRIDSLDVVVLEGGGQAVLDWVNENGFDLPPGQATVHMLDYYASRSPYFLAARFDAVAAAEDGFVSGDGIPVQIVMPTPRPWVPLHILHGAKPDSPDITADIFLLTPERPDLLHGEGLTLTRSEQASELLLNDLRSDENMDWVPDSAWLSYLVLDTPAENVTYDLSVGVGESGVSFVDAGLTRFEPTTEQLEQYGLERVRSDWEVLAVIAAALAAGLIGGVIASSRRLKPSRPIVPAAKEDALV